jgi:RNA polymerase sigma factor (sigma-70 family)
MCSSPAVSCGVSSEQQLIADLKAGVDGAFDRLYEQYSGALLVAVQRKGASARDAEDVVQETFLRVSTNLDKIDETKSLGGYLRTIATRIAIDTHRKNVRRGVVLSYEDSIQPEQQHDSETEDTTEEFAFAMTILDEQPELTKQIVRMYFFDQMTYLEIAQQLGIGVTTAKDRVKKAIGAVQQRAVVSCCE